MYSESIKAGLSAVRMLFNRRWTLPLLVAMYAALLGALYLFVSTREATLTQLALTLGMMLAAPVLFFGMQAVSVSYANGTVATGAIRKIAADGLKLIVVTVPLLVLTGLALYGLGKFQGHPTVLTAIRYLLAGVVLPLVAIQLWLAASSDGLRWLVRRIRTIVSRAFAPQSVFVYGCGVLIFAVAPYFLIFHTTMSQHAWLDVSLLVGRLVISAVLILIGWVTTVGTLSILAKRQ
jgi:hypothetical protein